MQSNIVKNTISLIISKLIPSLLLTLINVIYSRYLLQNDYGVYQTVWTYLSVFVIISTFGLPRYILTFGSLYNYPRVLTFKLIAFLFLLTTIPIIAYLFFVDATFPYFTIFLFVVLLLSQSLYLIQEANVISVQSNKLLIYSNIIYAILLFVFHLVVLFIGFSIDLCLFFIIAASLIRNAIIYFSLVNISGEKLIFFKERVQLFWFGLNDTLQILTKWLDKIILVIILSASDYAVYFNGTYEIPLIGMALSAFQSIITTQSSKKSSTDESNVALFKSSASFMSLFLFPLFAFCFVFSREIITILFSSKYIESASLFAISSLLIPMRICNYTVLLQVKSRGDIILRGSIIDFITAMLLMFVLYPLIGLEGLALSMVIATYIQATYYVFMIKKIYNVKLIDLFDVRKLIFLFVFTLLLFFTLKYFFF